MSTFQTALLIIFGAMLLIGTLIFSGILPGFRSAPGSAGGVVTMWGFFPDDQMAPLISFINKTYEDYYTLEYVAKERASFEAEFVEALADGVGPDVILIPNDLLASLETKLLPISTETVPLRDFQDTYVDAGAVLVGPSGLLGMPLVVDPLVMYYNKDVLASSGLANPPELWAEFTNPQNNIIDAMTVTDPRNAIVQSAVAMGETNNIPNLKDILSMLVMQAGNPIVTRSAETGGLEIVFQNNFNFAEKPAVAAVNFYTQFSNPTKLTYSWNSAQPTAQDAFVAGKVGLYFGRASEFAVIKSRNPHLNFDVSFPPQRTKLDKRTYGVVYSAAVVKNSVRPAVATQVALSMASAEAAGQMVTTFKLPSARKDVLAAGNENPTMALFNKAALISRSWLDPNPAETTGILSSMIQEVVSGRQTAASAVARAQAQMETLIEE